MIDFLSNTQWINPQIDFLLFLQNIRISLPEIFDKFFLSITIFGEYWLPALICAIIYWCIDFKTGIYLFTLGSFNIFVAHLFKMIACVYRPWVLDERIKPSKLAVPFAKGYSFPSGHSSMSSSVLGGVAYFQKDKKAYCILLILLILLIGFSRLWLGVHTPQDVVFGLGIGLAFIFLCNRLINWAEKDNKRYIYLLVITNIFAILAIVYMLFLNSYKVDYVDGELLVDPQKQKYAALMAYMYSLGIVNGCFLCGRFFRFNPKDASVKSKVLRIIVGVVLIILLIKFGLTHLIFNDFNYKLASILTFLIGFTITFIYPYIFTKLDKYIIKDYPKDSHV